MKAQQSNSSLQLPDYVNHSISIMEEDLASANQNLLDEYDLSLKLGMDEHIHIAKGLQDQSIGDFIKKYSMQVE